VGLKPYCIHSDDKFRGCSNYNIGYDYVACGAVVFVPGWNSGIGNCFFKGYPFVLSNNSAVESAVTTTY
jgi:hypothetical protein